MSGMGRVPSPRKPSRRLLIRYGEFSFSAGRCRGQRRPATMQNGEHGRSFWLPGLSFEVRWGDW